MSLVVEVEEKKGYWKKKKFKDLKLGNIFRIFINGVLFRDKHGYFTFEAKSETFINSKGNLDIEMKGIEKSENVKPVTEGSTRDAKKEEAGAPTAPPPAPNP